jgi:hypothetical protein
MALDTVNKLPRLARVAEMLKLLGPKKIKLGGGGSVLQKKKKILPFQIGTYFGCMVIELKCIYLQLNIVLTR